jgi:hypothetical protein
MERKRGKKSETKSVPISSTQDALITSMGGLAIAQRVPPISSNNSHGAIARLPRRGRRDIIFEFNAYFGDETKLENWQRMCRDIGIEDYVPSITKCKTVKQNLLRSKRDTLTRDRRWKKSGSTSTTWSTRENTVFSQYDNSRIKPRSSNTHLNTENSIPRRKLKRMDPSELY